MKYMEYIYRGSKKIIISAALSCTIFGIFDVEEFRNLEI